MSKYFNRGHYGLQSATERLSKEWSASDLKQQASLYLDFANGEYFTRSLSDSGTPKQFGDILTFTRDSDKAGFAPNGLATVGADAPALPLDPATGERLGLSIHGTRTNGVRVSTNFNSSSTGWVFPVHSQSPSDSILGITTNRYTYEGESGAHTATGSRNFRVTPIGMTSGQLITLRFIVRKVDTVGLSVAGALPSAFTAALDFNTLTHFSAGSTSTGVVTPLGGDAFIWDVTFTSIGDSTLWIAPVNNPSSSLPSAVTGSSIDIAYVGTEVGSFATPPIITDGTALTRLADNCRIENLDQSDWFNPNEGTFVVDVTADGLNDDFFYLDGGGTANERLIVRRASVSVSFITTVSGTTTSFTAPNPSEDKRKIKLAFSYNGGVLSVSVGGGSVATGVSPNTALTTAALLGRRLSGGDNLNGGIKSAIYIPRAMTAEELQQASKLGE